MSTMEYTGTLTVVTCWCGMVHAVPDVLRNFQLRQHRDGGEVRPIYCPLGHQHSPAGEGEAEKLRKELDSKQRALDAKSAYAQFMEKQRDEARKAQKRLKTRIAKSVCPARGCKRCFAPGKLQAHLSSKHPGFVKK